MSELNVAFPATLDEVLGAVKETARGRWFLENYEARLRGGETTRLLQAISKLESHVLTQANTGHDAELVKRAREAISAARRDIGALDPTVSGLSTEAKLFAQLADKARSAFPDVPAAGQSVSRALQLVGELEKELSDTSVAAAPPMAQVPAKPAEFFKQDEAIFEPAPKQAPPALAVARELVPETSTRGAKLVVQRLNVPAAIEQPAAVEPAPRPQAFVAHVVEPAPASAENPAKGRIIVIRRKAEEMENVPLLDQTEPTDQTDQIAHTDPIDHSDNIQQAPSNAA
jgi:hypothetical protein